MIPSFPAQVAHAKAYGGVDRVGRGAVENGIDFQTVPWYKRIPQAILNVNTFAMWVAAQHRMEVCKDDAIFHDFRSDSVGLTARKKFTLALTRDVIKECISNIEARGAWDPRPNAGSYEKQKEVADEDRARRQGERGAEDYQTPSTGTGKRRRLSVDGHEPRGGRGSAPAPSVGRPKGYEHVFVSRGLGNVRPCASCWGVQKKKSAMVQNKKGQLREMTLKQAVERCLVPKTTFFCPGCNASVCPDCQGPWKHHDTKQRGSAARPALRKRKNMKKMKVTAHQEDLKEWREPKKRNTGPRGAKH